MSIINTKLIAGLYKYPATLELKDNKIWFTFKYNPTLLQEIKSMQGAKWHGFEEPPIKKWSVADTDRNWFQIKYLMGENPYKKFDSPLIEFTPNRQGLYAHQIDLIRTALTVHTCIWGAEMGLGKTLSAIEVMEASGFNDWWWVGPKNTLHAVRLEFQQWKSTVVPHFMSYENLVKTVESWSSGVPAPKGIIFDESSKLKNPTAKRSQAAMHVANAIREEHGESGFIIEMTGSPSPKDPSNWWHQAEIVCPGFLKEGDILKLKNRLGVISTEQSVTGGTFAKLVTWKDNELKCDICGQLPSDSIHTTDSVNYHPYVPSKNEVSNLYKRLKGLVVVKLKKDCLDIPDKVYKTIRVKPSKDIINAAQLITLTSKSAIQALTLLRELSDGFQYQISKEKKPCPVCKEANQECQVCHGSGHFVEEHREVVEVPCPKDEEVLGVLEDNEEIGRIVIYAGFTASIDRIFRLCDKAGWNCIRVDGRGWFAPSLGVDDPAVLYQMFKDESDTRKMAFIAHPGSAGMGLNLTTAQTILYYSNDFNAENRIQSEDRIHRIGTKGAMIIDLVHLPSDQKVIDNLKQKRELQALTMNDLQFSLQSEEIVR